MTRLITLLLILCLLAVPDESDPDLTAIRPHPRAVLFCLLQLLQRFETYTPCKR